GGQRRGQRVPGPHRATHDGGGAVRRGRDARRPGGPRADGQHPSDRPAQRGHAADPLPHRRPGGLGRGGVSLRPRPAAPGARGGGRVTDFLVGCDGRLVSGVFLATYVVAQRPSLGQVQIHQNRAGAVVYRLKPGRDFRAAPDAEYLRLATRQYLGPRAEADVEIVEELPPEPSGKYLFSRSSVTPDFLAPLRPGG